MSGEFKCEIVTVGEKDTPQSLGVWDFQALPVVGQKIANADRVFDVIACSWVLMFREVEKGDFTGICREIQNYAIYRVTIQDETLWTTASEEGGK